MDVFCLTVGLLASIFCLVLWCLMARIEAETRHVDVFAHVMLYVVGFVGLCLLVFGSVHVLLTLMGR